MYLFAHLHKIMAAPCVGRFTAFEVYRSDIIIIIIYSIYIALYNALL